MFDKCINAIYALEQWMSKYTVALYLVWSNYLFYVQFKTCCFTETRHFNVLTNVYCIDRKTWIVCQI